MRQGNGTDLLGAQDPRGPEIGVIYVSETDDRKSVLAAILTQEKLGREQVAIELPSQNKAFQRPQDFDDLKSIRRKLKAKIIFITPPGRGPADLARQRGFTVYSTRENYIDALRAESRSASSGDGRRGGILPFTGGRQRPAAASPAGGDVPAVAPAPQDQSATPPAQVAPTGQVVEEDVPAHSSPVGPALLGGAAGFAAGQYAAHASPPAGDMDDDDWALGPAPQGQPQAPLPVAPAVPAAQQAHNPASAADATPGANASGGPGTGTGPNPIVLGAPKRGRTTLKLPERDRGGDATAGVAVAPVPVPVVAPPTRGAATARRSTNLVPVVAGATAGAAVAGAATGTPATATPPATGTPRTGGPSHPPQRPRRQRPRRRGLLLLILALLLLTLLLACGITESVNRNAIPAFAHGLVSSLTTGGSPAPATVTITAKSQKMSDTFVITANTDTTTPDTTKRLVSLRNLTFTTQPKTQKATATGQGNIAAVAATGRLDFINTSLAPFTLAGGTKFTDGNGVSMVTDHSVTISAGVLQGTQVTVGNGSVTAHAVAAGASGNIPAQDINNSPCCTNSNSIFVTNEAFSGGQDPKQYSFLQQSDVNGVVSAVSGTLNQQGNAGITGQVQPNEKLAGPIQCGDPDVKSDQPVGDNQQNVASANISVSVTCTAQAYDQRGAQSIANIALQNEASKTLGSGYALVGSIVTSPPTIQQPGDKSLVLNVNAQGIWSYQITSAQQKALAKALAGKTQAEALAYLKQQPGLASYRIDIANGGTLPSDPSQIKIDVSPIAGLAPPASTPGGTSPGSGGSGTPVNNPSNGTPVSPRG